MVSVKTNEVIQLSLMHYMSAYYYKTCFLELAEHGEDPEVNEEQLQETTPE